MKEERVYFGKGQMLLEGLFAAAGDTRGAIISHPHSLMGGDMWNPVMESVTQALFDAGISTLRFNFRGVGGSAGSFDEGRGEQEDVLSALAFLEDRGRKEILPAGYSFGAWVIAGVLGQSGAGAGDLCGTADRDVSFRPGEAEGQRGAYRLRGLRSVLSCGQNPNHGNRAFLSACINPGGGSFLSVTRNGSCRLYAAFARNRKGCDPCREPHARAISRATPARSACCAFTAIVHPFS